ncbi:MAG: sugar kinase [Chloroflexi bacterium]|nr:sugar kinase [Chloroflexota bacterium]
MTLLVVGSVALDSVETPFGQVREVLGGSATYSAASASLFTQVNLVAVVGKDFPREHLDFLCQRSVDLQGLQVVEGETFRWSGRYDYELNTTHTLETRLNVFADFHPALPESYKKSDLVFLANIHPELQLEVLRQVYPRPRLVMADTMDFWIRGHRDALERVLGTVDVATMNESEVRMWAGTSNLLQAARRLLSLGPKVVIIKQGEHGAVMFNKDTYFLVPAYLVDSVVDPTGAGDSFAGAFLGYLDQVGQIDERSLRRAVVYGCAVASFTVQGFSLEGLRHLTPQAVADRYLEFYHFTHFHEISG